METINQTPHKIFVAAGAGAGKTRNLVEHIAKTFIETKKLTGKEPRIVGTTFTRKAANEIKDRVALYANDPESDLKAEERLELFNFAYSDYLNITTIHGVCLQLLMKKAYLLGYSPDVKLVSTSTLRFYQRKILFDVIQKEKKEEIFLNFPFSDLLNLFDDIELRQVDFDRPAAFDDLENLYGLILKEIKERSSAIILELNESSYAGISTRPEEVVEFIKQGKKAFAECFKQNDLSPLKQFLFEFKIPRQNASEKTDPELFEAFDLFKKEMRFLRDDFLSDKKYAQYFDKSSFNFVVNSNKDLYDLFLVYKSKVNEFKKQRSMVTMSEVESLTLELLLRFPSECQDFIDLWDYWYIDEYQDTSPIQNEIFKFLLKDKPYYKVGDPQQSIYLFRGAKASIFIEEMREAEKNSEIEYRKLSTNYRSHPNLMAGINEFFEHLGAQSEDLSESFERMETKEPPFAEENKRLNFVILDSKEAEKKYVIEEIQKLKSQGIELNQICILGHNRKILAEFEEELTKYDISCLAQFSGGFTGRPEIQGFLSFLKVMDNPHIDIELIKLLRTQFFKVKDEVLYDWCNAYREQKSWSLWESLQDQADPSLTSLRYFLEIFKSKDYIEGIKIYFTQSQVLTSAYNLMDLARRKANLFKLYAFTCQKSEITGYNLKSLIDDIESENMEELASEAVFSESKDGVRLYTIHGSKGLEFEHVFLIGSGNKRQLSYSDSIEVIPDRRIFLVPIKDYKSGETISTVLKYFSKEDRIVNEKKEGRRVIYVAATRAEENLKVVGVASKNQKGDLSAREESLFKMIGINTFINKGWEYISIETIDSESEGREEQETEFQFLNFENYQTKLDLTDLDKKVFSQIKLDDVKAKQSSLIPMSVTGVVEKLSGEDLEFIEVRRQSFTKVSLSKVYGSSYEQSKMHMEMFMKPFIGDVFHKTIELYSRGVNDQDLLVFLKNFFSQNSEEILNLIHSISEIKSPDMKTIFKNANSEWGFNALYDKNVLLSGQVDMWGFDDKGVLHIFDYKTGSINYLSKAALQLGLYLKVMQQIYPDTEIQTHVVYPAEGALITLEIKKLPPLEI